jgi:hypothetical protein
MKQGPRLPAWINLLAGGPFQQHVLHDAMEVSIHVEVSRTKQSSEMEDTSYMCTLTVLE